MDAWVLSLVPLAPCPCCLLCAAAEKFEDVQKEVASLLQGRILVGHAVHNDLKVCEWNWQQEWTHCGRPYPVSECRLSQLQRCRGCGEQ